MTPKRTFERLAHCPIRTLLRTSTLRSPTFPLTACDSARALRLMRDRPDHLDSSENASVLVHRFGNVGGYVHKREAFGVRTEGDQVPRYFFSIVSPNRIIDLPRTAR